MNFQTMEYFRAIAEQRSFTKAAEQLHVTQQTLSAHIAGVERELGARLVVRSTPLRLTHEGETFLSYAKRFERGLSDLRRELGGPSTLQHGTLRVGISFTRGRTLLPGVIERFCELPKRDGRPSRGHERGPRGQSHGSQARPCHRRLLRKRAPHRGAPPL